MPDTCDELHALLSDTRALRDTLGGQSVSAKPGSERAIGFVASWAHHINSSIGLILYADERAFSAITAPLQRLMVEHAIAAAMLAEDPQSWEAYLRHSTEGAKKLKEYLTERGRDIPEDLTNFIDIGIDEESPRYRRYRKIRDRFEGLGESGDNLYFQWLGATQMSHAGALTAYVFLRDTPDDDWPTVTELPQVHTPSHELLHTCIDCLLWCQDSFSSMLVDDPLRDRIDRLNDRRLRIIDSYK